MKARIADFGYTVVCKLARRLQHIHRRIYREVGQGHQVLRRKNPLTPVLDIP
jgi:hypothetical protein